MVASSEIDEALFWELADPLIASGQVEEGVLMQSRCIRSDGEFVACPEYSTGDLVVKLPAERVRELVDSGQGLPFAPAKKVFKEWVQVPGRNEDLWTKLLADGVRFAAGKKRE